MGTTTKNAAWRTLQLLLLAMVAAFCVYAANDNQGRIEEMEVKMRRLSRVTETRQDSIVLANMLARHLDKKGIPFARRWAAVAVVESGWGFNEGVGQVNNLFGMRCSNRAECKGCTDHGYAIYESTLGAANDLYEWAYMDMPTKGESFEDWLKRRGWNPVPEYYDYLGRIIL